jgi:ribosomal protein L18E
MIRPGMDRDTTAALISDVELAVRFVDRSSNPTLYRLVEDLNSAFAKNDAAAMTKAAAEILDHATYRYAAVVEQADRLLRYLSTGKV